MSAARHLGMWVPGDRHQLHVVVDPNDCQLREPTSYRRRLTDESVTVHWSGRDDSQSRVVVPPLEALKQIALCQDRETTFVVAESALNKRMVSVEQWERILAQIPASIAETIPAVGHLSGSGIESIFVSRIRALGLPVRQQVNIPGVGFVDALIGDRLIVELDGAAFHRDDARDRRRDAVSSVQGFRVLRFLANQVTAEWLLVERAVIAAVVRGDHLA